MQGMLAFLRYFQLRSAPTAMPSFAVQKIMPASTARRAHITSPAKSKKPGQSSTLILQPPKLTGATLVEIVIWRLISSGS